jgi:hypothetical protein
VATAEVYIDGSQVQAITGSSTRRLNRPSNATCRVPNHLASGGVGSRMKVVVDGDLHHHGTVLMCETNPQEDTGYTVYNSTDPMELWQWRPARDADGDFSKPSFIEDFMTGPQIMEEILTNSENDADPAVGEGPLFLSFGTFETGGSDLSGAPVDWPMTIAEIASLLVSTGELDIVITPIDSGGNMGQVSCYNGDYGTDLSGSVILEYGMGARNIRDIRWVQDMTNMCNKLWYYAGPRIGTAADPAGDQHWCFNVTGTSPALMDPPYNANQVFILAARDPSQAIYGVRMEVKIFDAYDDDCIEGFGTPGKDLYLRMWQMESWIRQQPRELIHVTPTRDTAIGSFDIGDLIRVRCTPSVRGGFDGVQRIFEYTVGWGEESVLEITDLQTSPNTDGL